MSGYLGYDIDLVEVLRLAMRSAGDALGAIHCADVEARGAMVAVAAARSTITDTWLPFVDSLFQCRALDGYAPALIDPGDLLNAWLAAVAAERGWRVATDPLAPDAAHTAEPITVEGARALGEALSGAAGSTTLTTDEIAWLHARLAEIAARPELVAAFLPAFSTVGWAAVCNQLGTVRQRAVAEAMLYDGSVSAAEQTEWAPIDAVFASLGTILTVDRVAHPNSDVTTLFADMTPYAAALLVQHLTLDAETLSVAARRLIERERVDLVDSAETNVGPRAADLLLAKILVVPGAATTFVLATLDDPGLVLDAAFDPAIGNSMITAGTDPQAMTAAGAADAIPALVRWILDASTSSNYSVYNPLLAVAAADLIAPYLLPILRPSDDGYGMTADERRGIELLVVDNNGAFEHLLTARQQIVSTLSPAISDAATPLAERVDALRDLAALLAIIDTMSRAAAIRSAEHEHEAYELMWTALGHAVSPLGLLDGPVSNAGGPAVALLRSAADHAGWGPESIDSVRAASLNRFDAVTTAAAAMVVGASFDSLVAAGRIRPGTPLPPVPDLDRPDAGSQYAEDFGEWTLQLEPAVAAELMVIKQTIASDHEAESDANSALLGL